MNREEHLRWTKDRAIELAKAGKTNEAMTSFISDLNKHDETREVIDTVTFLGMPLFQGGFLDSPKEMIDHLEGYN